MTPLKKILVFIENQYKEQPALKKAIALAEKSHAELVLFATVYDESVGHNSVLPQDIKDSMRDALVLHCDTFLEEQASLIEKTNLQVITRSKWCANPLFALDEIFREISGINLIVKAAHQHNILQGRVFTPMDWYIIRQAPAPVLLARSNTEGSINKQLVALDASSEEEQHQKLNKSLMNIAEQFSTVFELETSIVNAYPLLESTLGLPYNKDALQDLNKTLKEGHIKATQKYANLFDIPESQQYVEGGEPSKVIPDVAKTCHSDLVIIGTVARHGLSNLLVGNTSEAIIDKLETDVLVVNPTCLV